MIAQPALMKLAQSHRTAQGSTRQICVLLAEDDGAMRGFVAGALIRDGYCVVEIANGTELKANLKQLAGTPKKSRNIDVVVSDIHMPGKTALEVLGEFRQVAAEIPIVLVTAFGSEETHEQALALGAAAVLDKPFDLAVLRAVLRDLAPFPQAADRER
jgi:CheY-like chemotaxis protein